MDKGFFELAREVEANNHEASTEESASEVTEVEIELTEELASAAKRVIYAEGDAPQVIENKALEDALRDFGEVLGEPDQDPTVLHQIATKVYEQID